MSIKDLRLFYLFYIPLYSDAGMVVLQLVETCIGSYWHNRLIDKILSHFALSLGERYQHEGIKQLTW